MTGFTGSCDWEGKLMHEAWGPGPCDQAWD